MSYPFTYCSGKASRFLQIVGGLRGSGHPLKAFSTHLTAPHLLCTRFPDAQNGEKTHRTLLQEGGSL